MWILSCLVFASQLQADVYHQKHCWHSHGHGHIQVHIQLILPVIDGKLVAGSSAGPICWPRRTTL